MREKVKIIYERIKEKKKIITIGLGAIVIFSGVLAITKGGPTLVLKQPSVKITSTYKDDIIIPVVLSSLPNNSYPATSVSIKFDNNKLEFIGLTIGTMQTYDDYDETKEEEPKYKIPQWVYNADIANQEGEIRAMYLDTTAGKNAYTKDGFEKKTQDMPFKLVFKLKDSVIPNDKLEISIEEAMFATVTGELDKTTLSTKDGYGRLNTRNTTINIKE